MFAFRVAPSQPPSLRHSSSRNMHAGARPFKPSRPRRTAAVKARNNILPSSSRPLPVPNTPRSTQPEPPVPKNTTKPMHPLKKRLTRAWNEPSTPQRPATQQEETAVGENKSSAIDINGQPLSEKLHSDAESKSKPAESTVLPPRKMSKISSSSSQPQRRRYPKLLLVDKDGQIVPNPLKLPSTIPPAPFVVPGDIRNIGKTQTVSHNLPDGETLPSNVNLRTANKPLHNSVLRGKEKPATRVTELLHDSQTTNLGESHVAGPQHPLALLSQETRPPEVPRLVREFPDAQSEIQRQISKDTTDQRDVKCASRPKTKIAARPSNLQCSSSSPKTSSERDTAPRQYGKPMDAEDATGREASSPPLPFSDLTSRVKVGRKVGAVAPGQLCDLPPVRSGSSPSLERRHAKEQEPQEVKEKPAAVEQVIQVGNRCGNQEYWRSSLQMPKRAPVKKAASKANTQVVENQISFPSQKIPKPSRETPNQGANEGDAQKGLPADEDAGQVHEPLRTAGEVDPVLAEGSPEVGQHHEFWRKATKLPSINSDKVRQRRLAEGKRRALDSADVRSPRRAKTGESAQATAQKMTPTPVPSDRVMLTSRENDGQSAQVESFANNKTVNANMAPTSNGSTERYQTPQEFLDEDLENSKKIIKMKEYEVRQMEAYAESRFHIRMNLRGRKKLENWLAFTDTAETHSVMFLVFMMDLDRRLISLSSTERKQALEEMENDSLRMLEALMMRLRTNEGYSNWYTLTANFNLEQ